MLGLIARTALLGSTILSTVTAIPTISVYGAKLFAGGEQFFIKGAAYQGTKDDPLIDTNQCSLDIALMQSIGTNSIRVYHVDPTADHSGCMTALANAGIYVWLDLDTFTTWIQQSPPTWTQDQFQAFAKVMDSFHSFDNLAGFWVGNEVITSAAGSLAAPYIKAAVADMKAYQAEQNYRTIPIGYSAADIAELRPSLQNYLACGDPSQAIDFFGLNSYEWCGAATYESSGYVNLQSEAEGYSIPIFFSETGCNVGGERTFADQAAIFGPDMIGTWSGSIIYEWVQESNDYGVVTYPGGGIYTGAPIPIQPDFSNLANQWQAISPVGVNQAVYKPSFSAPACPASTAGGWLVDGNPAIPTLGSDVIKAGSGGATTSSTSISTSTTSSSHTASPASIASTKSSTSSVSPSPSKTTSVSTNSSKGSSSKVSSSKIAPSTTTQTGSSSEEGSSSTTVAPASTTSKKSAGARYSFSMAGVVVAMVAMLLS